jgi:hypothetical protein
LALMSEEPFDPLRGILSREPRLYLQIGHASSPFPRMLESPESITLPEPAVMGGREGLFLQAGNVKSQEGVGPGVFSVLGSGQDVYCGLQDLILGLHGLDVGLVAPLADDHLG